MRTRFDVWPSHFWNNRRVLPLPLQVRRLDANRALGVTAYYHLNEASVEDLVVAAADRVATPYVARSSGWVSVPLGSGQATFDGTGSAISLTDDQAIVTGQAADRELASGLADANVLYYQVGDDDPKVPRTDVCYAERTLVWFRHWLAARYQHSDALLQAAWGAGATLATATMPEMGAGGGAGGQRSRLLYATAFAQSQSGTPTPTSFAVTGTYAPWLDYRRFMMAIYSAAPALARTALRQADARALIATSGEDHTGLRSSRDWWIRGRALDVVGRYGTSIRLELQQLGTLTFAWTAYHDPDPVIRYRVASVLGLGDSGVALFKESSIINPDLSLPEAGRDLAAVLLPTRRGVGRHVCRRRAGR